jgi:hypothetical protein
MNTTTILAHEYVSQTVIAVKASVDQPVIEDPTSWLSGLVGAAQNGQWLVFSGFLILIFTFLINRIVKWRLPKSIVPWVSIGLGILSMTGLYLATGKNLAEGILAGVISGLLASGSYSAVGKHVGLKQPKNQ